MLELPSGVDIDNLIDDIRILCWQAADVLLYYSTLLEDGEYLINKLIVIMNNIL